MLSRGYCIGRGNTATAPSTGATTCLSTYGRLVCYRLVRTKHRPARRRRQLDGNSDGSDGNLRRTEARRSRETSNDLSDAHALVVGVIVVLNASTSHAMTLAARGVTAAGQR